MNKNNEKSAIVDRIEADIVILEQDGQYFEVSINLLPTIKEGDRLSFTVASSNSVLSEAQERLNRLKKNQPPSNGIFDL